MATFEECDYNCDTEFTNTYVSPVFSENQGNFQFQIHVRFHKVFLKVIKAPLGEIKIAYNAAFHNQERITEKFSYINLMKNLSHTHEIPQHGKAVFPISTTNEGILYKMEKMKINIWSICIKSELLEHNDPIPHKCPTQQLLTSMLSTKTFRDLKIKVGSRELNVHKNVLASASPIFRKLIIRNERMQNSPCIVIEDFTFDIVLKMVYFLYKGYIPITDYDTCSELFSISQMYDIRSLNLFCTEYFMNNVNESNIRLLCILGEYCGNELLKTFLINYLLQNPKTYMEINFASISKKIPKLLTELLTKITENISNISRNI